MTNPATTITFRVTVEVEFSADEWRIYKDGIGMNYGEEVKTKKDAKPWLEEAARQGVNSHVRVQGIED